MELHDLQSEKYILGYLINNKDSIVEIDNIKDVFYDDINKQIYEVIVNLYENNKTISIVTIVDILKNIHTIASILIDINECSPFLIENFQYSLEKISKLFLVRSISVWLYENYSVLQRGDIENINEYILKMVDEAYQYTEYLKPKKDPDSKKILNEILADIDQKRDIRHIEITGKLGKVIPGFFPGHLIMLSGYTSTGKSFFLNQLIVDIYKNDGKVLIFSLEDSSKDKVIKILASLSGVHQTHIITNDIDSNYEVGQILSASHELSSWDLFVYDDVYNISEIKLKIKKHKIQNDIDVVCIDFVQNMKHQGTIYEKMSYIALELQTIAKELGVTIIALSQVSNEAVTNSMLMGLKGAGELASAADIILRLIRYKEDGKENWLDCEIKKNRPFGKTGVIEYEFNPSWTKLEYR